MTWIKTIAPEEADGDLKEVYRAIGSARGGIADVHRVQSMNPRALRAHLELYRAVVFGRSQLRRIARERIAVVVRPFDSSVMIHASSRPSDRAHSPPTFLSPIGAC